MVERAGRLVELREEYLEAAATTRSNLPGLVELLFKNPFLTVARVERALGLTNQGARNLIRVAERREWVTEIGASGRGGRTYWVARRIFNVIEAPMSYRNADSSRDPNG